MKKTGWRDYTYALLQNRNVQITFKKISEDTGIPEEWLSSFSRNRMVNPGVNTIQTLCEYLSNKEINF